jgi:hypothetical protein
MGGTQRNEDVSKRWLRTPPYEAFSTIIERRGKL